MPCIKVLLSQALSSSVLLKHCTALQLSPKHGSLFPSCGEQGVQLPGSSWQTWKAFHQNTAWDCLCAGPTYHTGLCRLLQILATLHRPQRIACSMSKGQSLHGLGNGRSLFCKPQTRLDKMLDTRLTLLPPQSTGRSLCRPYCILAADHGCLAQISPSLCFWGWAQTMSCANKRKH